MSLPRPAGVDGYGELFSRLDELKESDRGKWRAMVSRAALDDLYLMLAYVLSSGRFVDRITGREAARDPWVLARVRDVERGWDGVYDEWSRGSWKSTIKSFALPLQLIAKDPTLAIMIVSVKKRIAQDFLAAIRDECTSNPWLHELWPNVFWPPDRCQKAAPRWGVDTGLTMKREGSRKEPSIRAHGFLRGISTGTHVDIIIGDDLINEEYAIDAEMRAQCQRQFSSMMNLVARGAKKTYQGTPYHPEDLYVHLSRSGVKVRRRCIVDKDAPAPDRWVERVIEGKPTRMHASVIGGKPLYMTAEELVDRFLVQGPVNYAFQILLDTTGGQDHALDPGLLCTYTSGGRKRFLMHNIYILVDMAHSMRKGADPTAAVVVAASPDRNLYIASCVKEQIPPHQRLMMLCRLYREWKPTARNIYVRIEDTGNLGELGWMKQVQEETHTDPFSPELIPPPRKQGVDNFTSRVLSFLQPIMYRGILHVPSSKKVETWDGRPTDLPIATAVWSECEGFPASGDDHILAALALLEPRRNDSGEYIARPVRYPPKISEREKREMVEDERVARKAKSRTRSGGSGGFVYGKVGSPFGGDREAPWLRV